MAAAPIYAIRALRDCKYEPASARARTSVRPPAHLWRVYVRHVVFITTHTHARARERGDGGVAQWRNCRVNGRTDAAMRKNLARIQSPGVYTRSRENLSPEDDPTCRRAARRLGTKERTLANSAASQISWRARSANQMGVGEVIGAVAASG